MTFRSRLQTAFVLLGVAAIAVTDWQASSGATEALRQATYDRLTAAREAGARQLELYFDNVRKYVLALASDESTVSALEEFDAALDSVPSIAVRGLEEYHAAAGMPRVWFPRDHPARTLQYLYAAKNSHPHGAKDLLLSEPLAGRYDRVHTRYHPTFHRYRATFGWYDIFLVGRREGRVLYTVMKEPDLGTALTEEPYRSSGLARIYQRALAADDEAVLEDYTPYVPSKLAPAAFVAAPVRRAGAITGVLAAQISIEHVNRVMTAEDLGETGQAYIVGPDNKLRSDFRFPIEQAAPHLAPAMIEQIKRNGTAVLTLPVNLQVVQRIREGERGTEVGFNLRGAQVLRSHAPLKIEGLDWAIIAEIESAEALAPVTALRNRIVTAGIAVAGLFFLAAGWLAASVTRPVRALAAAARRLGRGDLTARVPVTSNDEIGQLAADFNRMSEDLQQTTVSKTELQVLAGRLITAQEDERRRIARELHDDLTQRVAVVAIEAGRWERNTTASSDELRDGLARLKEQMARIAADVHGVSRSLHPAMLDDLGLVAAIETECRAFLERGGPPVDLRIYGAFDIISKDLRLGVYRLVQESLRNVLRHSGADEVALELRRTGHIVTLTVRDNGRGFDRSSPDWHGGLGLASMEERVRLMGGVFEISSSPGAGTRIRATLAVGELNEEAENPAGRRS